LPRFGAGRFGDESSGQFFASRRMKAKEIVRRERSRGLSRNDAASEWLRLNRADRERFARELRTDDDLRAWQAENRRKEGRTMP
jgi:hypothetical protein